MNEYITHHTGCDVATSGGQYYNLIGCIFKAINKLFLRAYISNNFLSTFHLFIFSIEKFDKKINFTIDRNWGEKEKTSKDYACSILIF